MTCFASTMGCGFSTAWSSTTGFGFATACATLPRWQWISSVWAVQNRAEALLSSYRLASADDWPSSLAHHYIGYRAQVRALVSGLHVTQGDDDSIQEANRLLALALTHLDEGRIRLVVIGGPPGTGKSTWAAEAGHLLDAVVFRSDVERKRLAEVSQQGRQTASDADLYRPQVTESTYRALMEAASEELDAGRSVILDATFVDARWRNARARSRTNLRR